MEHKPLAKLQTIADVKIAEPTAPMSREQRLQRWIEVLEANANRQLRPLYQIEYLSAQERREYCSNSSPLVIAYEDSVLRAEGLKSDRVGDCLAFFQITERQVHHAFCSCHVGSTFSARDAAARLRHLLPPKNLQARRLRASCNASEISSSRAKSTRQGSAQHPWADSKAHPRLGKDAGWGARRLDAFSAQPALTGGFAGLLSVSVYVIRYCKRTGCSGQVDGGDTRGSRCVSRYRSTHERREKDRQS